MARLHVPMLDAERRRVLERLAALYARQVVPRLAQLPRGVVHNDANDHNVLVQSRGPGRAPAVGLIDFGDMVRAPTAAEPAVATRRSTRNRN